MDERVWVLSNTWKPGSKCSVRLLLPSATPSLCCYGTREALLFRRVQELGKRGEGRRELMSFN